VPHLGVKLEEKTTGKQTVNVCACAKLLDFIPVIPVEQFLGGHMNIGCELLFLYSIM
jgi:hypothetical protein